jgi:hypothetical protein
LRTILGAVALFAAAALCVPAAPPAKQPKTGHILVLDGGRVLEGDIERVGDQFCIRRPSGELWVAGDRVQCLCADLAEAYQFLRAQANLGDADEHLRLARWCQAHNLRREALAEVSAAVELQPDHAESRRLLQRLQRSDANAPAAVQPAHHEDSEPAAASIDMNADAMAPFVTRVQPILMNACANCHASGKGGNFKLIRTYDGELTNRRATQQNLAAVLAQLNRDRLQSSPLLAKAVIVHGDAGQPPLKNRQAPAYRILEEWAQLAMSDLPRETAPPAAEPHAPKESRPAAEPPPSKPLPTTPPESFAAPPAKPPAAPTEPAAAPPNKPPTATGSGDPFDPALFNQQMHPDR